ncbi:MAG: aldehyde dehydrogenase family protein [Deltaproteobacteria bacterium]|jgi:succinate-semialdehyde dehydrogenase|nr:aldehyde dehydrogenase family protein [Deltaproteobacteria bacterium]
MDNKQFIAGLIEKARAAQSKFETFDQRAVDKVCLAIAKCIYDNAEILAEEAVAETGMGDVQSKIRKQRVITMSHFDHVKGKKSVGIIEEDPELQVVTYAKPIGVIACITPTTNPTSTACGNGVYAVKSRNALIVAPHPRAKKCTAHAVHIIREAMEKAGGFADLMQVIEEPTVELSQLLMASCDATIATGGPGMVKAAYSSGRPSFGVGGGNCQSFFDRGVKDLYDEYAICTIRCKNIDGGVQCNGEQCLHLPAEEESAVLDAFKRQNAVIIEDEATLNKIREVLFLPNGGFNPKFVGLPTAKLAEAFGIQAPANTTLFLLKASGNAHDDLLCREKLCLCTSYLPYKTFEEGVNTGLINLKHAGAGHSAVIFSYDKAHIDYVAKTWPVGRLSVNIGNNVAGGNSASIGYNPTISLGCGTWGGNSISENLTYRHLMNMTKVGTVLKDAPGYDPEKVFTLD